MSNSTGYQRSKTRTRQKYSDSNDNGFHKSTRHRRGNGTMPSHNHEADKTIFNQDKPHTTFGHVSHFFRQSAEGNPSLFSPPLPETNTSACPTLTLASDAVLSASGFKLGSHTSQGAFVQHQQQFPSLPGTDHTRMPLPEFCFEQSSNSLFRLLQEADPSLTVPSLSQIEGLSLEAPSLHGFESFQTENSNPRGHTSIIHALNLGTSLRSHSENEQPPPSTSFSFLNLPTAAQPVSPSEIKQKELKNREQRKSDTGKTEINVGNGGKGGRSKAEADTTFSRSHSKDSGKGKESKPDQCYTISSIDQDTSYGHNSKSSVTKTSSNHPSFCPGNFSSELESTVECNKTSVTDPQTSSWSRLHQNQLPQQQPQHFWNETQPQFQQGWGQQSLSMTAHPITSVRSSNTEVLSAGNLARQSMLYTESPPHSPQPAKRRASSNSTDTLPGNESKRSRNRQYRKQPSRNDFDTDEAFSEAWAEWRSIRERNNAAVHRSREKAKVRKAMDRQALEDREREFQRLKTAVDMLEKNVHLLIKARRTPDQLTPLEEAWLQTLCHSDSGLLLASQCALFA